VVGFTHFQENCYETRDGRRLLERLNDSESVTVTVLPYKKRELTRYGNECDYLSLDWLIGRPVRVEKQAWVAREYLGQGTLWWQLRLALLPPQLPPTHLKFQSQSYIYVSGKSIRLLDRRAFDICAGSHHVL